MVSMCRCLLGTGSDLNSLQSIILLRSLLWTPDHSYSDHIQILWFLVWHHFCALYLPSQTYGNSPKKELVMKYSQRMLLMQISISGLIKTSFYLWYYFKWTSESIHWLYLYPVVFQSDRVQKDMYQPMKQRTLAVENQNLRQFITSPYLPGAEFSMYCHLVYVAHCSVSSSNL